MKKSKLAHNDRRRLETHGFGGGNVREGYLGDERGVGPSNGSASIAQKLRLDRPTDPKRGTVRCGIAKKKKVRRLQTWDKVGEYAGQTDEDIRAGGTETRPRRIGARTVQNGSAKVFLVGGGGEPALGRKKKDKY